MCLRLQHFIVFEEDPDSGAVHKIIAGYHQFHAVNAAVEETVRASGMEAQGKIGEHPGQRFHMNEGHASLLPIALLDEQAKRAGHDHITHEDIEEVRRHCVFTTHTPVPAGQPEMRFRSMTSWSK